MSHPLPINVEQEALAAFCRRHHIEQLAFFGSVLTERFTSDSDVDVLVKFDPAHIPTLFDIVEMEDELAALFGRRVDLRTPNELSEYFRDEVMRSAVVQYAA